MKKIFAVIVMFSFFLSTSLFANEDIDISDAEDMFSEYIKADEGSSEIELTEDKYEFDYSDYIVVKYTSRTLKDGKNSN